MCVCSCVSDFICVLFQLKLSLILAKESFDNVVACLCAGVVVVLVFCVASPHLF